MRQWPFLVLAGGLLLGACGLLPGFGGPKVSGEFQGDWSGVAQGLRLALVGLTTEGQVNYDNQLEIKDPSLTKGYLMELPPEASEGSYRVVAYRDDDNNATRSWGTPAASTSSTPTAPAPGSTGWEAPRPSR